MVEEGEVSSDNLEKQEQTEDMTFRETVRSVRSFMGWDYITDQGRVFSWSSSEAKVNSSSRESSKPPLVRLLACLPGPFHRSTCEDGNVVSMKEVMW